MREKAEDPYVSLGICSRCHKGILGTQYKMCAECREKKAKVEAKRLARETPEQAEARKERVRTRYYMNKSSGICVKCGKRNAVCGTVLCNRCLAKRRSCEKSTSQREYREDKGLCIICGRPAVSGRKHCEEHLKMLRKTVANAASHIDYTKHPWIIDNKHIFENLGERGMKLKTLGSGSSGNCYMLENDKEALIIEAGLPFMEVKKALDFNVMKIKAVITTHFHIDHSLYSLQYVQAGIPVFEPCRPPIKYSEMRFRKGNFDIRAFENRDKSGRWLHNNGDGSECPCVGFYITHPEMGSLVYATDTEYVRWRFNGVNHIMVEANYDMQFVNREEPNYEHRLRGHMSLPTALDFISTNDNPALRNVVLIHLSDKSGDPALFKQRTEETVKYGANVYIAEKGLEVDMNLCPF